jgi:hypothetical protein
MRRFVGLCQGNASARGQIARFFTEASKAMIVRAAMPLLLILNAFAIAAAPSRVVASSDDTACQTFKRWFTGQPGSQLALSSTNSFDEKFARPRKPDNILDYSTTPGSNDQTFWYKAMKHYRITAGSGRCMSAFYDSAHKTALIFSEGGTRSDLTPTNVSTTPAGLPNHPAPSQTQNGVRLGMTVAQVQAIEGPGTLRSDGQNQRLMYSQKTANAAITNYLGFLFINGKLVAADVGGGV